MLSERRHWEKIENRKKIVLEVYIRVRLLRINSISIFVKLSESAFIRTLQVLSVSVLRATDLQIDCKGFVWLSVIKRRNRA